MAVLNIEGRRVTVDDAFLSMTPEQQSQAVEEIAAELGVKPNQAATKPEKTESQLEGGTPLPAGVMSQVSQLPEGSIKVWRSDAQPNLAAKGHMVPGHRLPPALAGEVASAIPFADEIVSGAGALVQSGVNALTGEGPTSVAENFAQNQAFEQAQRAANEEQAPGLSAASEVMGGLMLAGQASPGAAPSVLQRIMQGGFLKQTAGSAAIGGGVAGIYGLGEGAEGFSKADLDERIDAAKRAMGIGAGIGFMFPMVTRFAGAVAGLGSAAVNRLKGSALRGFARELDISSDTLKRVMRAYDDTAGGLSGPEADDMLLDLSPQFRGQAEAIAQQPGRGGQIIEQNVLYRKNSAGRRIKDVIEETIGSNPGRAVMRKAMLDEQKQAGRMMNAAKNSGIQLDITPVRSKLNEVADIIAVGDQPLRALAERLPEGLVPAQIMHDVRRSLSGRITKEFGVGGNPTLALALKDVRQVADQQLRRLAGWRDANRDYMIAKRTQEAFADGQKVFANNAPDPSEIAEELAELRGVSPRVTEAFVKGARDQIEKWMGTARNDAGKVIAELAQKGWNAEKIEMLVGPANSRKLMAVLTKEKRFQDMANTITGNSATARRIQGQKEFPSKVATDAEMTERMKINLPSAAFVGMKRLATRLTGSLGEKKRARIAEEFGDLMVSTGVDLDNVIDVLKRIEQMQGRKATVRDAWRAITQQALPAASISASQ